VGKRKIVVDGRMIRSEGHGIATYVSELAKAFVERKGAYELSFIVDGAAKLPDVFQHYSLHPVEIPFLHPTEVFLLPKVLKSLGAALYHSPSFSSLLYYPCPHILTLHDLNHLHFGSWKEKIYYHSILRCSVRSAKKVLTVSHASQKEIAHWLGRDPDSIAIATNVLAKPPALRPEWTASVLKKYGLEKYKFFFCLSNPKPHKNLPFLFNVYKNYREANPSPWPLAVSVKEAPQEGLVFLGNIPPDEKNALLESCGGFLFPSLYEGFGLPPLEAALHGRPIVASNIAPHQETLGAYAEVALLDPHDRNEWVEAFRKLQAKEIASFSAKSIAQLEQAYSSERLFQQMDAVYRECLGLE
jgi:glycosyltransferase involved in cell wall biosynthesis